MITYILIGMIINTFVLDAIIMLVAGAKDRTMLLNFTCLIMAAAKMLIWPVTMIFSLIKAIQLCNLINKEAES